MSKRALLIAEKPDAMKKFKAVYDKYGHEDTIVFKSLSGHVVKLKEPGAYKEEWGTWNLNQLPMIPDKFEYEVDRKKSQYFKEVRDEIMSGSYDYIINAMDGGREGENIYNSTISTIGCNIPEKRLWVNSLTEEEINRALNNLIDGNEEWLVKMKRASQLRSYFDWGIGMNFSRAITLKANSQVNIGRVMTPVLKMIVDREFSISNFKPVDFWEVEAEFNGYKGIYVNELEDGSLESRILSKSEAERIHEVSNGQGEVKHVIKEEVVKRAPRLYSLSDLQNDANDKFGYTLAETLEITQSLYEKQFLSYPRTDSSYVTESIASEFGVILESIKSVKSLSGIVDEVLNDKELIKKVSKNTKYVNDKKVSDHYAIIVTNVAPNLNDLSGKEKNIYTLVAKRLLSIFLNPMRVNKTMIISEVNNLKFKSTGKELIDLGYKKLYADSMNDVLLPEVSEGMSVECINSEIIQKKTSPPERLTDRSVNELMENSGKLVEDKELKEILKEAKGIGTPATRDQILEKLIKLNMVERKKKSFYATEYGIEVIDILKDYDVASVEMTAVWEQKLRMIENCTYDPDVFYEEMVDYIKKVTEEMKSKDISMRHDSKTIGSCPKCGKDVVETKKYYLCSDYSNDKKCDFVIGKEMWGAKISKSEAIKILSGKETKEYSFKMNKNGQVKEWKSSLIYDSKEGRISFPKRETVSVCKCPKCGNDVVEGKGYYLCKEYKKSCDVIVPKTYLGAKINKSEVKTLLMSEPIKEREFKHESKGQVKKWKAKVKLDLKNMKFLFISEESKVAGKCPKCGNDVVEGKSYYLCREYKKTCDVIIPKEFRGANISIEDARIMLSGGTTGEKELTWKSGEKGKVKLRYVGKIEFVFK